ncbi:MAG: hypothetical protein IT210_07575 [Armatimonadetes bacterium]|nr:hypothetical protein [Armatimonadota bacterium]
MSRWLWVIGLGIVCCGPVLAGGGPGSGGRAAMEQGSDAGQTQPSSARARQISEGFREVQASYDRVKDHWNDLIRVTLTLNPELLLKGEEVKLQIACRSTRMPNPELEIWEDCYSQTPARRLHRLRWDKDAADTGYRAEWKWRPRRSGNYLLRWRCDIGGDIEEFWRHFAVVAPGDAVIILNSTSHREPRPEPDFHALHLPFSYWAESLLFGPRGSAKEFAAFSRGARQYGDDPGLMIFHGGAYLPGDQTVFVDEPVEVQRAVLESYRKLWPMLGFAAPLRSLYTYGLGNRPARMARNAGYNLLGALCADQNWGDGPFKINHWGMPARPYPVGAEDFRKPGDGGP